MIKIKVLDLLNKTDRNIKWLSEKTDINYSTLYNFAHSKTNAVSYEIIEKLCKFYNCQIQDIIYYSPMNVIIDTKKDSE